MDILGLDYVVDCHEARFGAFGGVEIDFVLHFCGENGGSKGWLERSVKK